MCIFSNISKSVCTVLVIKVNTSCSNKYTGLQDSFIISNLCKDTKFTIQDKINLMWLKGPLPLTYRVCESVRSFGYNRKTVRVCESV